MPRHIPISKSWQRWLCALTLGAAAHVMLLWPQTASAQWTRSGDWSWGSTTNGTAATTVSQKYGSRISLWVMFDGLAKCAPKMVYSTTRYPHEPRLPVGPFAGGFEVRVDTQSPWKVRPGVARAFYTTPGSSGTVEYAITLDVPLKFILELAYGNVYRVFRTDTGETDRFGLAGSAVTLGNAFRACEQRWGRSGDPDLQYFNQGQYRQPSTPSTPSTPRRPQDADRQFFR
jgi:hypothetical protein